MLRWDIAALPAGNGFPAALITSTPFAASTSSAVAQTGIDSAWMSIPRNKRAIGSLPLSIEAGRTARRLPVFDGRRGCRPVQSAPQEKTDDRTLHKMHDIHVIGSPDIARILSCSSTYIHDAHDDGIDRGLFLAIFARNTRPREGSSGIRELCAGSGIWF